MRRFLPIFAVVAAVAGCVSVEGLPDPHGTFKPGQRLVVAVYPSPGPWIVGSTDSKAESAAKITPLGFLVQSVEDEHTLSISKNLQQYLPRPRLALAAEESLMKALQAARSTQTVQTPVDAGIATAQMAEWNKSKDQLDWRQRYYAPDPDAPAPRDYARMLTLDDALILDVNVSFGTDANEAGNLVPQMSASSRVYRGDTSRLLWQHEDVVTDPSVSSATITDYMVAPAMLTESLKKIAPSLGSAVATSFLQAFTYMPSTSTPSVRLSTASAGGGGLVSMDAFAHLSTATASSLPLPPGSVAPPPAPAPIAPTVPGMTVIQTPPAVSVSTPAVSVSTSPP
jgi:hypothetical protein